MDAPQLPRPDMLQLAAEVPLVIDGHGRIWQTIAGPRPGCWFQIEGHRYGLLATETLRNVEERYLAVNRRALDAFKEHELGAVAPDVPPAEAEVRKRRQAVRLVRERIIPRLAELDLTAPPAPRPAPARKRRDSRPSAGATSRHRASGAGFLRPLEGRLVFFERVFGLVAAEDTAGDPIVRLRQRRYVPASESLGLQETERRVMRRLRQLLRAEALRQRPRQVREARRCEREAWGHLGLVAEGCIYECSVGGVLVQDWRPIVFFSVPPFAVQDLDGCFYAFPATRVGLPIESVDPGETLRAGRVRVLDPSFCHPFVSDSGHICMVTDASYYADLQRGDLCSGILQLLQDARTTLSAGFAVDGTPFRALNTFGAHRVDRARIERDGLPLFRVGIS